MSDQSLKARWGDDLLDGGFGIIPYMLLDALPQLEIPAEVFLFIIHVFRFKRDERNPFPSLFTISRNMGKSLRSVQQYARFLEEKDYLRRNPRLGQASELDFSLLLEAVRKLHGMKFSSSPEDSGTQGVQDSASSVQESAHVRRRGKEVLEEEPVLQPPLDNGREKREATIQAQSPDDKDRKFLESLEYAEQIEAVVAVQEHWLVTTDLEPLPDRTAAYWVWGYPKGLWNYLERYGKGKAVELVIKAIDKAYEKYRRGGVKDIMGYLNAGIQGEKQYLIKG